MGNSSLKEIEIVVSVERIGDYAFEGCDSLERVVLSTRLKGIRNSIFMKCRKDLKLEYS